MSVKQYQHASPKSKTIRHSATYGCCYQFACIHDFPHQPISHLGQSKTHFHICDSTDHMVPPLGILIPLFFFILYFLLSSLFSLEMKKKTCVRERTNSRAPKAFFLLCRERFTPCFFPLAHTKMFHTPSNDRSCHSLPST